MESVTIFHNAFEPIAEDFNSGHWTSCSHQADGLMYINKSSILIGFRRTGYIADNFTEVMKCPFIAPIVGFDLRHFPRLTGSYLWTDIVPVV